MNFNVTINTRITLTSFRGKIHKCACLVLNTYTYSYLSNFTVIDQTFPDFCTFKQTNKYKNQHLILYNRLLLPLTQQGVVKKINCNKWSFFYLCNIQILNLPMLCAKCFYSLVLKGRYLLMPKEALASLTPRSLQWRCVEH